MTQTPDPAGDPTTAPGSTSGATASSMDDDSSSGRSGGSSAPGSDGSGAGGSGAGGSDGGGSPEKKPSRKQAKRDAKAHDPLRSSRTSGIYAAVVALGVVLILLIIFIAQNTESAGVKFLGFEGSAPQSVLLLIALAAGIFLTLIASSLRLLQVRRRVKRERKAASH